MDKWLDNLKKSAHGTAPASVESPQIDSLLKTLLFEDDVPVSGAISTQVYDDDPDYADIADPVHELVAKAERKKLRDLERDGRHDATARFVSPRDDLDTIDEGWSELLGGYTEEPEDAEKAARSAARFERVKRAFEKFFGNDHPHELAAAVKIAERMRADAREEILAAA